MNTMYAGLQVWLQTLNPKTFGIVLYDISYTLSMIATVCNRYVIYSIIISPLIPIDIIDVYRCFIYSSQKKHH